MNPGTVFVWIWWVMLADIIIYLAVCAFLFAHLRRNHLAVWEELGSPALFWNNSIRNNMLFLKFMLRGSYRQIGDPLLVKLAMVWWILLSIASVLFVVMLIGTFSVPNGAP